MKRKIAALAIVTATLTGCAPLLNPVTGLPVDNSTTNTASVVRPGIVVRSTAIKVVRKTCGIACQFSGGLISAGTTPGERIVVQVTGGPQIAVSQAGTNPVFTPGERVVVVHNGIGYRVKPATGKYALAPTPTHGN
ncbi:exported protein of unknown function [Acidithiobacillus ferrivorans]|uniref:Lipoprotein n=1 Tax=Acidithiobacillus ferrivorans TaxID=160808 RepID=A0A060UZK8_9PROT|nr:hypothetical protein [Acidithiobacillus ferrivorans]CDQ12078.1 exported hypothetical protein [Acidithiobacillus ferrivorans]SMH64795.1 exported protein of unknown function [Acidithiobacillus ferrivorans]